MRSYNLRASGRVSVSNQICNQDKFPDVSISPSIYLSEQDASLLCVALIPQDVHGSLRHYSHVRCAELGTARISQGAQYPARVELRCRNPFRVRFGRRTQWRMQTKKWRVSTSQRPQKRYVLVKDVLLQNVFGFGSKLSNKNG